MFLKSFVEINRNYFCIQGPLLSYKCVIFNNTFQSIRLCLFWCNSTRVFTLILTYVYKTIVSDYICFLGMFCEAFQMRLFFSSNLLTYEEFFVSSSALLGYLVLENQRFTILFGTDLVLTHMEIGWKMSKFETLDFLTRLSWGCQTTTY